VGGTPVTGDGKKHAPHWRKGIKKGEVLSIPLKEKIKPTRMGRRAVPVPIRGRSNLCEKVLPDILKKGDIRR